MCKYVSIPFKREGLPELHRHHDPHEMQVRQVSIPFKREGLPERLLFLVVKPRTQFRFNSLQTGRTSWTVDRSIVENLEVNRFNSLQTGRTSWTAPSANPVTARTKIAKTKRDWILAFFWTSNSAKLPINPYKHWIKHEFFKWIRYKSTHCLGL